MAEVSGNVREVAARLLDAGGGSDGVYASPGLRVRVYVLVAPEPDRQQPHDEDEAYVVLEGSGVLTVAGERSEVREGDTVFVPAGVEHRFSDFERLVVLVIFVPAAAG